LLSKKGTKNYYVEEKGNIILCFKLKTHTFEVLGGFGFWPKTFEKSFGFGQNLKNPRNGPV